MGGRAHYPAATGDPVFRVVVHRGRPEHAHVEETCLSALQHFGLPHRIVDLADGPLAGHPLDEAAGIILAQDNLGAVLSEADVGHLIGAIGAGVGLVNLDGNLAAYPAPWHAALGLHPTGEAVPCLKLRLSQVAHPVTTLRDQGEEVALRMPVWLPAIAAAPRADVLLDTGDGGDVGAWVHHQPAMVATALDAGRTIHFLTPSHVWRPSHLGHGNGLTDLLWRSIVWTARRPFVAHPMPPFVTTRLDNATGKRDHFAYVDVFNDFGYVAVLGLLTHEVSDEAASRLAEKAAAGHVECSAHAGSTDCRSLFYGNFDLTERSDAQLRAAFAEIEETFARWRLKPARVVNADWGIVGRRTVPFLLERGHDVLMKPLRLGRAMYDDLAAANDGWRPRPFGTADLVLDTNPDAEELFVASVQLPRREGIDFLQRCPVCAWNPSAEPDLETFARKGARMIRRGLDNLVFGCLLAHEERIYQLSDEQLRWVLSRIDEILGDLPRFHRGYDAIAAYARSRHTSAITHVARVGDNELEVTRSGKSDVEQCLSFFAVEDVIEPGLSPRYCVAPAFAGDRRTICSWSAAGPTPDPHRDDRLAMNGTARLS